MSNYLVLFASINSSIGFWVLSSCAYRLSILIMVDFYVWEAIIINN